jgi:hypothetical protein
MLIFSLIVPYFSISYHITSYTLKPVVGRDGILDIHEVLNVTFDSPQHGIYRTIPTDLPGWLSPSLRIFDISVLNTPVSVESTYHGIDIRMGDPKQYVIGDQTYDLS